MSRKRIRGLVSPMLGLVLVATAFAGCGELTGPTSPSTPSNVTATLLAGGTSVTVSWTPSPQNDGVVSYNIFRNGTKVGQSNTTSFTDIGLAQQQTYRYTISANCTSGVISDASAESAAATVLTRDLTPPTVISRVPVPGATGVSASATITVVFSEPMDPATINPTTINLKVTSSGAAIPGTVAFNAATRTAVFTPNTGMPNPAGITATVTTGAKDLAGNSLVADVSWTFTTVDQTPPTVLSTTPANGASVPPSVIFFVSFSEAMDALTINGTNITLKVTSSGAAVAGNVNYNTTTHNASFSPNQTLAQNIGYTLTISGAVKDVAGNQMGTAVTVAITTADVTPPTVVSTIPADGATGISPTAPISATFSEPMDVSSVTAATFTLKTTSGQTPVTGTVTYDNTSSKATFTPSSSLASATSYTATITTGVKDVSQNAMAANKVWTFTTADVVAPTVMSVSPANGSSGASANSTVQITFSEPMAAATINSTNVFLKVTSGGALVPATVAYDAATNVATLTPSAALTVGTNYMVNVTTGATDVSGNGLASQFTSTFTTFADTTPPTVSSVTPANNTTNVALNSAVQVTFSEPMDPLTITTLTVTLKNTLTSAAIVGSVSYTSATNTATFTPSSALSNATNYTVTVTTGAKDAAGNALAAPFTSNFTTIPAPDTTPPTVLSVVPANNATGIATNTTVQVTFSEAMDQATLTTTTISLKNTATSAVVAASSVGYNTVTHVATLTLSGPLSNATNYTVTVTTGVKDVAGNAMAAPFTSNFTTVPVPDTTPPTIITRNPANNATNVAINTLVTVQFSEPMDASTINGTNIKLAVTSPSSAVAGMVTYDAGTNTATFTPTSPLSNNTNYTLTVTTGVKDVAGNALAAQSTSTFTTLLDTIAPTIIGNSPTNGTTGVAVSAVVTVTFSEAMDVTTINGTNIKLNVTTGGAVVAGTVSYNTTSHVATFTPTGALLPATNYTATVTTGVKDSAGNPLAFNATFAFTTAP